MYWNSLCWGRQWTRCRNVLLLQCYHTRLRPKRCVSRGSCECFQLPAIYDNDLYSRRRRFRTLSDGHCTPKDIPWWRPSAVFFVPIKSSGSVSSYDLGTWANLGGTGRHEISRSAIGDNPTARKRSLRQSSVASAIMRDNQMFNTMPPATVRTRMPAYHRLHFQERYNA